MSRPSSSRGPGPRVAVLAYHRIGEPGPGAWPTWFRVPEAAFVAHLRLLADAGWTPIGLPALLDGLDDPRALPPRASLITFDDALRCVRDVALPWLRRLGHPAVVFVPADHVGRTSAFDANEPVEPLCDWDDLRALARGGVAVQSHGASHRPLSGLDESGQADELTRSRTSLEAGLGTAVEVFAFPYGDAGPDPGAMRGRLRAAGYRAAFLYGGGPVTLPADRYRLPRLAMGPDTDLALALTGVTAA